MTILPQERPRPQPRSPKVESPSTHRSEDLSNDQTEDRVESLSISQSMIEFASTEQTTGISKNSVQESTQEYLRPSRQDSAPSLQEGFDERFVRDSIRSRLFGQDDPTLRIGEFVVFQKIGQGGGGAVYAAYDDKLGRKVALKFLLSEPKRTASSQARLVREAQAMARLSHPNVVQVYSLHELEGEVFLAMEIVEGQSVKDWLDQEPRHWKTILDIYIQAGKGLSAAHHAGLIHRDFKPSNVMIQHDGRVCVGDFGCASFQDTSMLDAYSQTLTNGEILEDDEDTQETVTGDSSDSAVHFDSRRVALTQTGTTLGTLAYMAPEQLKRKTANERSDQYSFCVALYEGLYGVRPQVGHIYGCRETPSISQIPQSINHAIRRGLSPCPQDRFSSIDELLDALRYQKHRFRNRAIAIGTAAFALMASPFLYVANRADLCDPCTTYEQEFADFLGPDLADRLEVAFSTSEVPFADETRSAIKRASRRYAEQWNTTGSDLCQASISSPQDRLRFGVQAECLERRREDLQHVLEVVLDESRATEIENAAEAVDALPNPARCKNAKALQGRAEDRHLAAPEQTKRIRKMISKAQAFWHAGDSETSITLAKKSLSKAKEIVHGPLVAKALFIIGRQQSSLKEAKATLLNAMDQVEADRNDDLAVDIWLQLLHLANREGIYSSAKLHFHRARAALNRLKENGERRASVLNAMAYADQRAGYLHDSLKKIDASLKIRKSAVIPDPLALSRSFWTQSYSLNLLGDSQAGLDTMQHALEIQISELGSHHPSVAHAYHGLGIMQLEVGKFDAAESSFNRASDIHNSRSDDDSIAKTQLKLAKAKLALNRGNPTQCQNVVQQVLNNMRETLPANSPHFADPLRLLGQALFDLNHYNEAIFAFESAIDVLRSSGSENYLEIARNLSSIAQSLLLLDDSVRALQRLDQALFMLNQGYGSQHIESAKFHSQFAFALIEQGNESEACNFLKQAKSGLGQYSTPSQSWIVRTHNYLKKCETTNHRRATIQNHQSNAPD